jgi:hypothetical protein
MHISFVCCHRVAAWQEEPQQSTVYLADPKPKSEQFTEQKYDSIIPRLIKAEREYAWTNKTQTMQ